MMYEVRDSSGRTIYEGNSWPMARAALDYFVQWDENCPSLDIRPETEDMRSLAGALSAELTASFF